MSRPGGGAGVRVRDERVRVAVGRPGGGAGVRVRDERVRGDVAARFVVAVVVAVFVTNAFGGPPARCS
jgi:hypothetical protein